MSLGIGEGEGGTPRPAEHLPALDTEVLAEHFDVADEVPSRVGFERRVWRTLAAAALIEVNDPVLFGVEEAPLFRIRAATGPAVEKDYGFATGVTAFLEVNLDRQSVV